MTSHDLSTHRNGVLDLMEEHTMPDAIFFPHNPSCPRRRAGALTLIALLAIVLCWSTTADAQELLLAADFDDKPLNQPIDTGGAALGEPVNVSTVLDAVVRDDVMPGKALALSWNTPASAAAYVRFQWSDDMEIRTGTVSIWLRVTPGMAPAEDWVGGYPVSLREAGSSAKSFGTLYFSRTKTASVSDATGGPATTLPGFTWSPGQSYLIEWVYDMDAGTYNLSIDGQPYINNRPHNVNMDGRGLGALLVGIGSSSHPDSRIDVDDILVTWSGEGIFADGFEPIQ